MIPSTLGRQVTFSCFCAQPCWHCTTQPSYPSVACREIRTEARTQKNDVRSMMVLSLYSTHRMARPIKDQASPRQTLLKRMARTSNSMNEQHSNGTVHVDGENLGRCKCRAFAKYDNWSPAAEDNASNKGRKCLRMCTICAN